MIACEYCGNLFENGAKNKKCCSKVCAKAVNSRKAVELRRVKKYGHPYAKKFSISCASCGVLVDTLHPRQKFCSGLTCLSTDGRRRIVDSTNATRKKQRPEEIRVCVGCKTLFKAFKTKQKRYCTGKCRSASTRHRYTTKKKKWADKHRARIRESNRIRENLRRKNDPSFKLRGNIRALVKSTFKNRRLRIIKGVWTHLGYTPDQLRQHIESFFNEINGFSWDNHGLVWQLDHITSQSWFSFTDQQSEEFKKCWALSNLKPEFKDFNKKKAARFSGSSCDRIARIILTKAA